MANVKKSPQNSSVQINLLIPIDYLKNDDNLWINFYLNTFFKIKEGSNLANIEKEMAAIYASNAKTQLEEAKKNWKYENQLNFRLQPFLAMHFQEVFVVDYRYFEKNLLTFIRQNKICVRSAAMTMFHNWIRRKVEITAVCDWKTYKHRCRDTYQPVLPIPPVSIDFPQR